MPKRIQNKEKIKASIIILNYNGENVLAETVNSVLNSNFPAHQYEIIIPDNKSTDQSEKILAEFEKNPHINVLRLPKNYGFAGGNNYGLAVAKGEYVILLNNDCVVDKNWLKELVVCADRHTDAFSINSKIRLYPRYLKLELAITDPDLKITNLTLDKSKVFRFKNDNKGLPLSFNHLPDLNHIFFELPFDLEYDHELPFRVEASHKNLKSISPSKLADLINLPENCHLKSVNISSEPKSQSKITYSIDLKISSQLKKTALTKIQNAGSLVFQDGYGRDIGAIITGSSQNYENDYGQYEEVKEVYSTCGAAVLYRKEILDQFGGTLDDTFFMYYEDTALAEQGRINGYKNYYCPTAAVNHLHALSSGEWSPFFIFHVEKGRLLHLYYNYPSALYHRELRRFAIKAFARWGRAFLKNRLKDTDYQYLKVLSDLFFNQTRYRYQKKHRYQYSPSAVNKNYQELLSGKWYFL